jgi:hypothetical protein
MNRDELFRVFRKLAETGGQTVTKPVGTDDPTDMVMTNCKVFMQYGFEFGVSPDEQPPPDMIGVKLTEFQGDYQVEIRFERSFEDYNGLPVSAIALNVHHKRKEKKVKVKQKNLLKRKPKVTKTKVETKVWYEYEWQGKRKLVKELEEVMTRLVFDGDWTGKTPPGYGEGEGDEPEDTDEEFGKRQDDGNDPLPEETSEKGKEVYDRISANLKPDGDEEEHLNVSPRR